ncbi:hypothetical protein AOLI_G00014560 [Acnodon oligacanthus]
MPKGYSYIPAVGSSLGGRRPPAILTPSVGLLEAQVRCLCQPCSKTHREDEEVPTWHGTDIQQRFGIVFRPHDQPVTQSIGEWWNMEFQGWITS